MAKNTAYIPKDMVITGNVVTTSDINVAGKIVGDITCEGDVALSGIIYGNVTVSNLKLDQGILEGEIHAKENVTLEGASSIKGNLSAKTLSVHMGASIHGKVCINE